MVVEIKELIYINYRQLYSLVGAANTQGLLNTYLKVSSAATATSKDLIAVLQFFWLPR